MAIYRLEAKIIGRRAKDKAGRPLVGQERSVVAKAADRSGERLNDERQARSWNFQSRTQEVVHRELVIPADAPDWMQYETPGDQRIARERLWNTIEKTEKRSDSQLAREFLLVLPVELDQQEQIDLVHRWCDDTFAKNGLVADVAIHRSKNDHNPHAHVLVTTRPTEGNGFGLKPKTDGKFNGRGAVGLKGKDELTTWRTSWCEAENAALEQAGFDIHVDHRSYVDQGIDKIPQPKIGVAAMAMMREGKLQAPERVRLVDDVRMDNFMRPVIRSVETNGETPLRDMGETWWERTWAGVGRLQERAAEWWKEKTDNWRERIRRERDDIEPEPSPGR